MNMYSKIFRTALGNYKQPGFGKNLSDLFMDWRRESPSAVSFKDLVEDFVGKPEDENLYDALRRAMELADRPSKNPYHNHHHNREVFLMTLALLKTHQEIQASPPIHADLAWTTLCAALLHDYRHDGGTNRVDDKVIPMRLEQRSIDLAKREMEDLDLGPLFWHQVSMIVLPTDITAPTVGAPSPSTELKQIFTDHVKKMPMRRNDNSLFASLRASPELTLCALTLSDADLSTSAGLCADIAQRNTLCLHKETKGIIAYTPQSIQGFVRFVCKGFPATPAGRELFTAGLQEINAHVNADIENGVAYEF